MDLSNEVHIHNIRRNYFRNYTLEAGLILENFHKHYPYNLGVQMINNNAQIHQLPQQRVIMNDGKNWIDKIIDMEMINIQNHYQQEENQYVEKMLIEQPPVVSVRRNTRESETKDSVQLQKAESCRRSRLNGKIKKAKTRFRHQFVTEKLSKSCNMLKNIYEVIEHAENKLIQGGFDRKILDELRCTLGMNKNVLELLNIESMENNNSSSILNSSSDKNGNFVANNSNLIFK